jgi:hypothetical protein
MNNTYVMNAALEARKNSQASMITAGFAGLMILLMFLLKWKLPIFEKITESPAIEVELNLPDEPPTPVSGGGGGGGNDVAATGPAGVSPYVPPQPGEDEESKDITTDDDDKASPPVVKPTNPKPTHKVVENTSVVKATPKPVVDVPAPRIPKAVVKGRTLTGNGAGGGAAEDYDRSGGRGPGYGVGSGPGNGGGTGGGNGGGNGPGSGTGNGPKKISGNRVVINPKPMNAGENLQGKVLAEIKVSPDGIGTFVRGKGGSLMNDPQAINIVRDWLRKNHFNKSDEESIMVYEFNIKIGG